MVNLFEFKEPMKITMSVADIDANDTAYGKVISINGIINDGEDLTEVKIVCDSELEYLLRKNNLRRRDTLIIEYLGRHQVKNIEKIPIYKVHVLRELSELSNAVDWKFCPFCKTEIKMKIYKRKRKSNRTFFICKNCNFIVGIRK